MAGKAINATSEGAQAAAASRAHGGSSSVRAGKAAQSKSVAVKADVRSEDTASEAGAQAAVTLRAKAVPGATRNNEPPTTGRPQTRWVSIGISCTLAWAFLINAAGSAAPEGALSWQASYIVLAAAMVVFGFVAHKAPAFLESAAAGYVAAGLGAAGSVVLVFSFATPVLAFAQVPVTILCSCVLGWLYLQWGQFYVRLNTRTAVGCLFVANIAGSLLKCLAHFSPLPLACAITMALPVASMLLCRMALLDAPRAGHATVRFESHNLRGLWKVAAAVAALSFVTAFLVGKSYGNQSSAPADAFVLGRVCEVLISAVVLAVVIGAKKSFNFAQLWRIVLVLLALDVLCQALLPQVKVIRSVESSAWDLLVLFTWLTVADIARHAQAVPPLVFGVGWAFYTAPFAVGSLVAGALAAASVDVATTTVLMFTLALVGTFCLELRDQDTKWIFAELSGERASAPEDHRSIDERCDAIAAERNLTPRELEVMKMLCKGRTKSYIAETLYLTENTVRSHTKHLYTKLDVHSKQELMDLVGA